MTKILLFFTMLLIVVNGDLWACYNNQCSSEIVNCSLHYDCGAALICARDDCFDWDSDCVYECFDELSDNASANIQACFFGVCQ